MIGQRRAKLEYGLNDDDLATLAPCSQRDGGLYDEADLAKVRDANPACQARLAEAKREEGERNLAIQEKLRQEREEAEKNEREFWQPLRNGRTPEQLNNDPWPIELVELCHNIVREYRKQFDERDHDFAEIENGPGNEIERIERDTEEHKEAPFWNWDWHDHLTGERKALFCNPGWSFPTFRDSIRDEVSELLDHYVFGGMSDEDERYEARDTYYILGIEDDLIDSLLVESAAS